VIFRLHPKAFRPALFPSAASRTTLLSSKRVEVFLLILHRMSVSGIPCGRSKGRWAANQSGRGTGSLETSRVVYVSSVSLSNCAHLSKLI